MQKYQADQMLTSPSRLKWACRRGMLELDVLLLNFLNEAYFDSTESDKRLFIQLLEAPDPDLFAWLMGRAVPPDAGLQLIVNKVRAHAASRF